MAERVTAGDGMIQEDQMKEHESKKELRRERQ
jgi:hypothetical protein